MLSTTVSTCCNAEAMSLGEAPNFACCESQRKGYNPTRWLLVRQGLHLGRGLDTLETIEAVDGLEWNSALTQIWDGYCDVLRSHLEEQVSGNQGNRIISLILSLIHCL